ncbi:MAG: hypothetical protein DAHOPDDO_03330 [Ignavibacteriaceae bacterium]|nr:hypothetical protein [Ignavibacteriaceae bacterium]
MKYKIGVNIKLEDRTEHVMMEGDDVNDVLGGVVEIQFNNMRYKIGDYVYQESDPKKKKELKKEIAKTTTENLRKQIDNESDLLKKSLINPIIVSWNILQSDFYNSNPEPQKSALPEKQVLLNVSPEPDRNARKYQPDLGIIDSIFASRKQKILDGYKQLYSEDYQKWLQEKMRIEQINSRIETDYNSKVNDLVLNYEQQYAAWDKKRNKINQKQKKLEESYKKGMEEGTQIYFEMVLKSSDYGTDFFDKKYFVKYFPDTKILFVEYYLPDKKKLTQVKEVKYVATRDEFQEVLCSNSDMNRKYDGILYEITLRTINELFQSDNTNLVDQIVFNGLVDTVNPSTGQRIKPCILSISVTKEIFRSLNLKEIDPKECFRGLKGVSASQLHSITPIPPIMRMDREDKRFIDSYSVTDGMDEGTNIAAMNWEDFEHLIREIFEKEFSQAGGEVKVTQASRDGGVDAIAFDPDPIRGGKIVIQAKRYTNVVGVAAVRDLYGTVVNEGATKGILVTTSSYGSDAYEFAKDKPLTLLNGSNLLHLLEKHGQKAKIDIQEARRILIEKENK